MFNFKITPDGDETYVLEATSRDVLQWERRNRGANITDLKNQMRMTDLYKIAYRAAVRRGLWADGEEDAFTATVDLDLDDDDGGGAEDPTPAGV